MRPGSTSSTLIFSLFFSLPVQPHRQSSSLETALPELWSDHDGCWTLEVRGPWCPTSIIPARAMWPAARPVGNTGFGDNALLNMLQPTRHQSSRAHGSCVRGRLHEGEPAAANCSRHKRLHDDVMRTMPAHHHHTLITSQWAAASHALARTQLTPAVHEIFFSFPRLPPSPAVQKLVSPSRQPPKCISVRPPGRFNTRTSHLRHHPYCPIQRRQFISFSLGLLCTLPFPVRIEEQTAHKGSAWICEQYFVELYIARGPLGSFDQSHMDTQPGARCGSPIRYQYV